MAVLAHPDDESFPIGGTLAKAAASGVEVTLVTATSGGLGIRDCSEQEAIRRREIELRAACAALGIADLVLFGYPDGHLAEQDSEAATERLSRLLFDRQPHVLITFGPDGLSGHPDHIRVGEWTRAAWERAAAMGWRPRLYHLVPSPATAQACGCGVPPSSEKAGGPMAYVDIGAFRRVKARAMGCHGSQRQRVAGDEESVAAQLVCQEQLLRVWPVDGPAVEDDVFGRPEDFGS